VSGFFVYLPWMLAACSRDTAPSQWADAWATALTVLGAECAMAVAQAQGLAVYFVRRGEGGFVHSHTPAFARYLSESQA